MAKDWNEVVEERLRERPQERAAYERAIRAVDLGFEIRKLREKRGLSRAEFARRLQTSQASVTRIESGVGLPRISTLERIAEVLEVGLVINLSDARPKSTRRVSPVKRRASKEQQALA